MRLTFAERIGSLRFRRYHHERLGIVETLTNDTVTYVRPVFSLAKPATRRSRSPSACVWNPSAKLLTGVAQSLATSAASVRAAGPRKTPDKKAVIVRNPYGANMTIASKPAGLMHRQRLPMLAGSTKPEEVRPGAFESVR